MTLQEGILNYGSTPVLEKTQAHIQYILNNMGYSILSGDDLTYARKVTQLPLKIDKDHHGYAVKKSVIK